MTEANTNVQPLVKMVNPADELSTITEAIEDIRNGKMVVLVDDEDRENEGDLVMAAQLVTPEAINFMSKHGRGLICLTLPPERVQQLGLPLMGANDRSQVQPAFTVSIEAREGVTTGMSAKDRAHTISVAINPNKGKQDLIVPGHIFPLSARSGGVLERAGHTEASVDLARLAGLQPAGVICEVINEDGEMARLPDLVDFAREHNVRVVTIADLIAYRLKNEKTVHRKMESSISTAHAGDFNVVVYEDELSGLEHVALIKNHIPKSDPVPVRMHSMNFSNDVLFSTEQSRQGELHQAMNLIHEKGSGVLVIIRDRSMDSVSKHFAADATQWGTAGTRSTELKNYGTGAQILRDLGVKDMILLTNKPKTIVGLDGFGLCVKETQSIPKSETPWPKF